MSNALAHEKSPYLLQHADNPVQWLPWGDAAIARAREEQKPIFLSIGYSTCHWCHVMAHESFESAAVAELLNAHFVPIKVDREERPDVDKVYMTYVQAMTGHGGWPLSAWLTPDLKPFYGGTYFPPEDRHGRPGFATLLRAIANGWEKERDKLVAEGERAITALREHYVEARAVAPDAAEESALHEAAGEAFEKGFQYFFEAFDPDHAGFGSAPKFPRASNLAFLFRAAALQGVKSEAGAEAIKLAALTLQAMARGGIHDHVGGGFHRYSVDAGWFVPHFEKMLYDQAQIVSNCLEAKQATGDERFAWLARDILTYVERDLASPEGAFYSAEDADSASPDDPAHKKEGAFYVWAQPEIAAIVGEDAPLFCAHFGVAAEGNVPGELDPQGELAGKNILHQRRGIMDTARAAGLSPQEASDRILAALEKLRAARERRPRPHRDDKIIAAWNGLMISAYAKAHQVLGLSGTGPDSSRFLERAVRAAEFLKRELYDDRAGILYRTWRGGRGETGAFAEDYADVIQALLDLYEAGFDIQWLRWAEQLQAKMNELFWDDANGGFYNSGGSDRHIVLRLKEDYDGAEPAAGSVAASNLLRLAAIFDQGVSGDKGLAKLSYRGRGLRCLASAAAMWRKTPQAMPQMLCALELALEPPRHVVIAGDPAREDFRALAAVLHEQLGPRRTLLAADGGAGQTWLVTRAPWLRDMQPGERGARAYVCEEFACRVPAESPEALRGELAAGNR